MPRHTGLTRELFNKASQYKDIIDLTLGDPDLNLNTEGTEAAYKAMRDGFTHYAPNAGILPLRRLLSEKVSRDYGIGYDSASEIIVTLGGMEGLFLAVQCLINPGDEVVIFEPYYPNYVQMVKMAGGIPVFVTTRFDERFEADARLLKEAVTDKTRLIILNSPGNPSGAVYSSEILREVADIAISRDLAVISDEVYKTLIYDGIQHHTVLEFEGMRERTVLINSISKEYCATGLRIGYVCADADLIAKMTLMQENVAACAATPLQHATCALIENGADGGEMLAEFTKRRDVLCAGLENAKGIRFNKPQATFYLFVDVSECGLDSLAFADRLLTAEHVAVAPGKSYGNDCDGFIRIAFTQKAEKLQEAAKRISRFVETLK